MRNFTEKQVLKIIEHLETKGFNDDCLTYEEELEHILKQPLVKNIKVIPCCKSDSELLKDLKEPTLEEWLKDNFIPLGNNGFTNRNEDTVWTKSELAEIHATLHL